MLINFGSEKFLCKKVAERLESFAFFADKRIIKP